MVFLFSSIEWPKSEFSTDVLQMERYILYYKGIFLVNGDCNLTFGKLYFPFMKLGILTLFIFSFFACVRIYHYLDFIYYVFMVTVLVTSLMVLAPVAVVMPNLYDTSRDFSRNLSPCICNVTQMNSKRILTRMLKSCAFVRSQIGNFYHMEAKAKLTMLNIAVNGVVFLLVNMKF